MTYRIVQQIVELSSDLVAAVDGALNVIVANHRYREEFTRLFGLSLSVGDNLREVLASLPEQLNLAESTFCRALAGETVRLRARLGTPERKNGVYDVLCYPLRDDGGTIIGAAKVARDITETAHWMGWALECAKAGTWTNDLVAGSTEWDFNIYRLLGLDPEKTQASPEAWLEAIVPEDRPLVESQFRDVFAERKDYYRLEYRVSRADGVRWLTSFGRATYAADGRPLQVAGLCIDLTDLREAERALAAARDEALRAQADTERAEQAKSHFLAAVSHDLRQPAQALTLLSHLVRERSAGTPVADLAQPIEQAVNALKVVLDGLLDISRLDAGVVEVRDEPTPITDVLNRLASEYGPRAAEIGLELRAVGSTAVARTDPVLLDKILRQLLENALRFTPRGRILMGCRQRSGRLSIEVLDTGVGIPDQEREYIFQDFYQLGNVARDRALGLGVGLAVVRRMAQLIGAEVHVSSEPGRGSRFAVVLPGSELPSRGLSDAAPPYGASPSPCLALVIEDEETVRDTLQLLLDQWGYQVVSAATGEDGLGLIESGICPSIVLADYQLGAGMTGLEAVEALRERAGKAVPALIITGDIDAESDLDFGKMGVGVLYKPFPADELKRAIAHLASGDPRLTPNEGGA